MTKNYTQSEDFKEESISLYEILQDQKDEVFSSKTQFKDWTINDVLYHLHVFNNASGPGGGHCSRRVLFKAWG